MTEGYVTHVHADGPDKPIRDEESYALASNNKTRLDTLQAKVLSLEAAHEYLNSSDTWFGFRVPIGNSNSAGEPVGNLFRLKHMQEIFKIGGYMVKAITSGAGASDCGMPLGLTMNISTRPLMTVGSLAFLVCISPLALALVVAMLHLTVPTIYCVAISIRRRSSVAERVMLFITGALIRVYFHNRNIQAARNTQLTSDGLPQGGLGMGADYPSYWSTDLANNPYLDLDLGIEKGDYTGLLSTTIKDSEDNDVTINNIPCFMGLKNFYKYLWTMKEDELLICQADGSQAFYVEEMIDGTAFDVSGAGNHLLIGKTPAKASAGWSYIKDISTDYLSGMPTEVGGSGSTYFADGYYNPVGEAGSVRGSIRLGGADSGVNAGSLCLYGSNAPSHANAYGGAVLCEFAAPFSTKLTTVA